MERPPVRNNISNISQSKPVSFAHSWPNRYPHLGNRVRAPFCFNSAIQSISWQHWEFHWAPEASEGYINKNPAAASIEQQALTWNLTLVELQTHLPLCATPEQVMKPKAINFRFNYSQACEIITHSAWLQTWRLHCSGRTERLCNGAYMGQGNLYASGQPGRSKQARAEKQSNLGTAVERGGKSTASSAGSARAEEEKDQRPSRFEIPGHRSKEVWETQRVLFPSLTSSVGKWFLGVSTAAMQQHVPSMPSVCWSGQIQSLQVSTTILMGEEDTQTPQAMSQPKQCLAHWQTEVSITCISFFLHFHFPFYHGFVDNFPWILSEQGLEPNTFGLPQMEV